MIKNSFPAPVRSGFCFSVCLLALSMGMAGLALTGCGIKPSKLTPPEGGTDTVYPATYPNPATDPE